LGNVIGVFGISRDITESLKAVQALRESEATYRSLFEHLLNGFAYCRMLYVDGKPDDFVYLSVNEAFGVHTGLKNVVGRKVSEVIPGIREADPGLFDIYSRVALGGRPEQFETYVNALEMWFQISVYSPKPEHFVAVFDVITERKNAEKALRKSMDLLQSVVENVPVRVFWKDCESRYLGCNEHFAKDAGYRNQDDLIGKTDFDMGWRNQAKRYRADDKAVMDSGIAKLDFEEPSTTPDGRAIWVRTSKVPLRDENSQIMGILGIYEDITQRKLAEGQLRKLSLAVEQSPESIAITDLDGNIEYVNEAFTRISGYGREELIGQNPRILQSQKTPKGTYEDLWQHLTAGITWEGEFYNKRKDGREYIEHATVSPIRQPDGSITHYVGVKEDITEKKRAEAEINRLAFYDTLTGLPNRALLLERTDQALSTIRRLGEYSALISFNINRFKTVNDAGGQVLGDALLKAVGERLSQRMHEGDIVARIAGDEFAILLSNLAPEQQNAALLALHISDKIHTWLLEPFHIGDESITLTATLGIALFPAREDDSSLDILRRSNTALHHAKTGKAGQTAFFEETLDEIAKQRFNIERELHRAIANGELRIFLQPQVEASGKIVGAEALVRWQHPQRGLIAPSIFIPIAEESNLIVNIGMWVFTEVCRLLTREDICTRPIRISVNISPRHFRQPNFVDQIKAGLASTGADPARLTLEVTEGMVIDNISDVIAKMNALSTMGIHFSMDDFGTGYSSLSYLKRLPIHELKIDKSFIQDLTIDPEDDALVETILAVAKLMHVKVVAEGVETVEQAAFLNQRAHVIHQGYLFGRPEHAEAVIANIVKNGQ
jgi:PAS domain S-box-containing protein/diguanylate cyclase (GGDEF)-like protein